MGKRKDRFVAVCGEALFLVQTRAVSLLEAQESIEGTDKNDNFKVYELVPYTPKKVSKHK